LQKQLTRFAVVGRARLSYHLKVSAMRLIFRPVPYPSNTHVEAGIRDKELLAMQTIDAQLPIVFNANKQWVEFTSYCACCKQAHDQTFTRGIITQLQNSTAQLEAVALCHTCKLFTRIDYRVDKNFSITTLHMGKWIRWVLKRSTFSKKLIQFIGMHFMVIMNKLRH
jgi:hypothetical protein